MTSRYTHTTPETLARVVDAVDRERTAHPARRSGKPRPEKETSMSVDRVVDSRCIRCGRRAMEKKTATAWRVPTAIVRAAIEGAGLPDESRNVVYIEHWELWEGLRVVAYVERVGERWWCSTCADRALEVRNEHVAEGFPALTDSEERQAVDDMMRFTVNEGGTAPDG